MSLFQFQSPICECDVVVDCGVNCGKRGLIIAPCCSLFNHSCFPNAERIFVEKKKIVIVTTQPVKKGEQVCTFTFCPFKHVLLNNLTRKLFKILTRNILF